MGKGLPKKYAAMGFKKGWAEYKKTKRKTAAKRKSSPKPKPRGSSKRYTKSSNPGGGASTTSKMGALFKKLKAVFNLSAGAQGSYVTYGVNELGLRDALARYTGVLVQDSGVTFDMQYSKATWAGMAAEIGVQWVDSKTRHFGNMSKGKLLDIVEELFPIMMAHEDAKGATDYMTQASRSYHKYTQGYDMKAATPFGDWNFDRMKPYATVKMLRIVGNKSGVIPFINRHLPKGINL